jgi:hypothetical protein
MAELSSFFEGAPKSLMRFCGPVELLFAADA